MSGLSTSNYYDEHFKLKVVTEVKSGKLSKEAARRKYGIKGKSTILKWIRIFDGVYNEGIDLHKMSNKERKEYEIRIRALELQLKYEKMRRVANDLMIDIAEKELKISIRKKCVTKQSNK